MVCSLCVKNHSTHVPIRNINAKMNPLVSVIIPTYNRELYIGDCIQSVIDQSYRPIELMLVDDGSTDKSIEIVKQYQDKVNTANDFKLILLQQANSGAPRARNYGFEQAKGTYIMWLDSDDLLLPHKIESQVNAFEEDTDVVYSRAQFFNEKPDNLMQEFWGRPPQGDSSDYFEFPWQTMYALYKKSALEKFGVWREDLSLSDDWEFSLRYKIQAKVKFLDMISSLYRHHEGDRVGNNLTIEKINSLSSILFDIYQLSQKHQIIDSYLTARYQSRLAYCLLQLGALKGIEERKKLVKDIQSVGLFNSRLWVLRYIKSSFLNRLVLKLVVR